MSKIVVIPDQGPSGNSPDATMEKDIDVAAEQRMLWIISYSIFAMLVIETFVMIRPCLPSRGLYF